MPTTKHWRFIFVLFIFATLFSFSEKVFASTIVTEDITEDTVWVLSESPYVVQNDISVEEGATLTIEPGVIVKIDGKWSSIDVWEGSIIAEGTEELPIIFTSFADDIGGDTDENEESVLSEDGWDGIYVYKPTGPVSFANVNIFYSSDGLYFDNTPSASLFNLKISGFDPGGVSLYESHIVVDGFSSDAGYDNIVVYNNSSGEFSNVSIANSWKRESIVVFNNSSLILKESIIEKSSGDGIVVFNNSSVSVENSIIKDSDGDGIVFFNHSNISLDNVILEGLLGSALLDIGTRAPYLPNSLATINSTIRNNSVGFDFYSQITPLFVSNNSIFDNLEYGVKNRKPSPDNDYHFENNWWGDESGPYHFLLHTDGLGDVVSDGVLFDPWCANERCGELEIPPVLEIVQCADGIDNDADELADLVDPGCADFVDDDESDDPIPPASVRNPVIIVPGVLGTEISKPTADSGLEKLWLDLTHNLLDAGDEFMDALQFKSDMTPSDATLTIGDVIKKATIAFFSFDYSESLIKEFQNQGYVEGTDLFLFPYDWRYGVSEDTVSKLKQKINDVLVQTGSDKVDIIAHSMGGLITKKYIIDNPEDNHIDKAVFVGVPNTGAPKAVKALIQGDNFENSLLADSEMKKISKNMPAAYDLLPSKQYIDIKGSYVEIIEQDGPTYTHHDLSFEESNTFLINNQKLNAQALAGVSKLHTESFDNYDMRIAGVDLYAIDGCKAGTIGKFIEFRYNGSGGDDYMVNNFKVEETPGDGTVPLESSTNLPVNPESKFYSLKGKHGSMLTTDGIRQKIVNIISGSTLSTKDDKDKDIITQDISECELNGRAISVFSPLSIDVVDQDGNHLGLASDGVSIENNIQNADFNIIDDHKFVYLPTDDGQTYTITLVGTGTGTFTITDATIHDNDVTQTQVFSNITVTPSLLGSISISNDTNTTLSLDTDGNGTIDQNLQPTSVLNATQSQDFVLEPPEENTAQENSQSSSHISNSGSRPVSVVSQLDENDKDMPPSSVLIEAPVVKKENTSKVAIAKTLVNTDQTLISEQKENSSEENLLTANVVDTDTPINYGMIEIILAGFVVALLIGKKFIKL